MDRKESPYDLRDPSRAPEVAHSYSPIPVYRESEGLQPSYDHTSGKEAVADERAWTQDEKAAHYGEAAISPQPRKWYRRKRWLIAIALAVLAVIAVAVGAGVGASSAGGGNNDKEGNGQGESQGQDGSQSTSTSPTTATNGPASAASSAAVAPATSGIADYSCNNGSYLYSAQPAGLAYVEHCNTMYAYNNPSIFDQPDGLIQGLFSSTKYSLQDCVDSCDDWNNDNPNADSRCRAVSYYANLTNVFTLHENWGGNCVLKSGVGGVTTNNTEDSSADYAHTASAYRACLQQGTPCDSSS